MEMNCKAKSQGVAKSIGVYINDFKKRFNTFKLFLCILTGVGVAAKRNLCRSGLYYCFNLGLIYPNSLSKHGGVTAAKLIVPGIWKTCVLI